MRRTLMAIALTALTVQSANAATDLPALNKELQVMSGILNTVLKQNRDKEDIRIRSLDTTYLAGQGVLVDINTSKRGLGLQFNFGKLMEVLPVAPVPPGMDDGDYEFHLYMDDEVDAITEDAMRMAKEALQASSEKLRELREQERELSWEMREYERRRKDLEFERRHADKDRAKDLDEESKELEKELARLKERQQQISQYSTELEKERNQQAEQQRKAKQAQHKAFLAWFEESVADVLCKYGAGLRAMPEGEHLSIALRDFGNAEESSKQDKIYIFKRQDIMSCVTGKLNASKLLQQANTYLF
ncbi:hypothetical protein P2G88_01755 [Aliiglaciecola sp. CAU 1673]|uniref:hypothetical protein n=1 Tax=Aliiglaciecola sp. CAU 1673 TaxID=3032595 RepID=UPI0023DC3915|nr:hypothetical protein [Aliiglaciecola sp. CAU 1673]MDF2176978.1 hypothetical protein [Aliiglaciecola sp. CAU 1673]